MGLFWDKVKQIFKKPAILADQLPRYERNERQEHPSIYKKSSGQDVELLKNVYVGWDPIKSNSGLHIRKMKSQKRNWKHWKKRI